MSTNVKPIPDGFHTLTPYLTVKGGAQAIEFYKKAFGAKERCRFASPDGQSLGHAEIMIGDSILMLADENPHFGNKSPQTLNGASTGLLICVPDVDAAFQRALDAGAKVMKPVETQFYGERSGTVTDPFGHVWTLSTHVEDVSPEEMERRLQEMYAKMAAGGKKC